MSSTGVREANDTNKRVIKGLILNEAQFIQSLRVFANTSTLSGLGSTEGEINNSPKDPSGNYLSRLGDKMLGPLALTPPLDFTIEIDANNTIDIGPLNDNAQYTSNVQLDSIQPNSFVLDIIANAAFDGQLLFLRTFAPTTPFTISQGTLGNGGNIQTGDGSDLTVGDLQVVTLIFDEALIIEANTGGSWRVLSVSSGGGGGVSFPIDFPEEDRGTVGLSTEIIDFTEFDRHSVIMTLTGDIGLSLINTTAGTLQITSIKLKQDGVGGHALTGFSQSVENAQVIIDAVDANNGPNGFVSFIVEFEDGIFTAYLKTGNEIVAGGIDEPIILGINELSIQTLPTTTEISWATKNPQHIVLDRAVEFNFTNLPVSGSYEGILVIIDIDSIGGFASPIWPGSLVNPPVIPTIADQRFSVMLYTINAGSTVTHATSVGSSTGGEFFGPWTANHDAGVNSLVNAAAVAYVDTLGFPRGTIAGDNGAAALRLSLATGGKFLISDVLTSILEIDDTTGLTMLGSHVINMGNNIINTISELQFSNSNAHTPSNELSIAFDINDDALKYSVALITDVHMFFADTDLLATFSRVGSNEGLLSIQAVTAAFLQATETLFLSTFNNTTPTNGDIWRDSGDGEFKFRQNGVTETLGGIPSAIIDGNTSATVLDAAPTFVVVLNGIQKYSISNTRVDYADLDLFGINQINMTDSSSNDISSLTASPAGLVLNIFSTTDVYDIQFNFVDAFHVDDIRTRILSTSPNISAATLSLFRDDASPTNGDDLGLIKFDGRNSAAEFITYAEISTTIESITDGAEFANLFVNIKQNGFDVDMLRIVNGVMILRTFDPGPGIGANFTLLKEDNSPGNGELIGNVNWNVLDSPTELTYARIQVFIQEATDATLFKIQIRSDNTLQDAFIIEGNDNSTQFQYLTSSNGNTRMQPLSPTRMGYFVSPQVTDFLLNLGTGGSLQIPQFSDGSPSLNDLNQAGGAFDGAIVHDTFDGDLYIRANSGRWDRYARTGTVV